MYMVAPPPSNVREARQLLTHGQKFDPESLYELFGQQISILDPSLHWTFWSVLV